MLAMHSSWFNVRLNTTLGYRKDNYHLSGRSAAASPNPADPRVDFGEVGVLKMTRGRPRFQRSYVHSETRYLAARLSLAN